MAVALPLLLACSKSAPPAPSSETAPRPTRAVAEAPFKDAAPVMLMHEASFAHFEKARLFECMDLTLAVSPEADAGPAPLAVFAKEMAAKKATKIEQSCAEAFADRLVLASCTYATAGDAGASLTMRASFYDYADVGLSDAQMADCLKSKGRWKAISRESKEWSQAKRDHARRGLQKAAEALSETPDP